jgi:hypothetical protein
MIAVANARVKANTSINAIDYLDATEEDFRRRWRRESGRQNGGTPLNARSEFPRSNSRFDA